MDELTENYQWRGSELCIDKNDPSKDCINVNNIIGVKEYQTEAKDEIHVFTIQKQEANKLSRKVLKLVGDKVICKTFVSDLERQLKTLTKRPRRLLVLLTPNAGSQNGEQDYYKSVAPLFEIANIITDVIVTERHEHILDILSSYPMEDIDGVAVCGGDGSFNQCINGIFERTQKSASVDYNNPDIKPKPTTIPVGAIPTGMYNVGARCCNGCVDIETAVLSIIQGSTSQLGILNLYADNKWIRGGCLGMCHGNLAEFQIYAEGFRWLKSLRVLFLLPYYLLFKRQPQIDATLTLMPSDIKSDTEVGEELKSKVLPVEETMEGTYMDLTVSCHETFTTDSYIGSSRWFSDHAVLVVYKICNRFRLLKSFLNIIFKGADCEKPDFIKEKNIIGCKMKIEDTTLDHSNGTETNVYRITLDGEKVELQTPEWELRLHESVVTVFSNLS